MDTFDELIDNGELVDHSRRKKCEICKRPKKVCLCPSLPATKILTSKTRLIILQHPREIKRPLNTAQILQLCLEGCHIFKALRFYPWKHPRLFEYLSSSPTYLLHPNKEATGLNDVDFSHEMSNIVILDGTWSQAQAMYNNNQFLHSLQKVKLAPSGTSQYVIRTQPDSNCLSTLECAAIVLSHIENNHDIKPILLKPLELLCNHQLQNGAQIHHPKINL